MPRAPVWLLLGSVAVFLLSYFSLTDDADSDPRLTLLVSQAIVDRGTIRLDAYEGDELLGRPFEQYVAAGEILVIGGHYTYYFPAGPSLMAAPAVALARAAGYDMRRADDNFGLQNRLSALTAVAALWLAYALCRCYLRETESLIIAFVSFFGSSLLSTLGTALWSHNFAVLFIGAALWLLARADGRRAASVHPVALGGLLFLAYFSRASAAAFIVPVLVYVLWRDRRAFLPAAITAAVLLGLWLLWNYRLTGSPLSAYYSTARLAAERAPLWVGLLGNLAGPSRGLLVFSPFLWVVIAVGVATGVVCWGALRRRAMLWLCLGWFALHLLIVARAASWWGGWSFGPRLLVDLWPGLILVTALVWDTAAGCLGRPARQTAAVAYVALGLLAAALHVGQGLYGRAASAWNGVIEPVPPPGVPALRGDLFNPRYAQPLATQTMICAIAADKLSVERLAGSLSPLPDGAIVAYDADRLLNLLPAPETAAAPPQPTGPYAFLLPFQATPGPLAAFPGWAEYTERPGEPGFRWSRCRRAQIVVRLDNRQADEGYALAITAASLGEQRAAVTVNGTLIGEVVWRGPQETRTLPIPPGALRPGLLNVIGFNFPDARAPGLVDQRPLALALSAVALLPGDWEPAGPAPVELPGGYP